MFVCMDVGVAAAYVVFAMCGYNVRVHGCRSCRYLGGVGHGVYTVRMHGCRYCRCLRGFRHDVYDIRVHGCMMFYDAGFYQFH